MKYIGHFIFLIFVLLTIGAVINSILVVLNLINGKHSKLPEDERKKHINAMFQGPAVALIFWAFISGLSEKGFEPFMVAFNDIKVIFSLINIEVKALNIQ